MDKKRPAAAEDITVKVNNIPIGMIKSCEIKSTEKIHAVRSMLESTVHAEPAGEEHHIILRRMRTADDKGTLKDLYGQYGFSLILVMPHCTVAFAQCRFCGVKESVGTDGYLVEEAEIVSFSRTMSTN